jgi:D-alanyl-lipoteichoic acid acyltransferase DltB (MBOAT superfamily)
MNFVSFSFLIFFVVFYALYWRLKGQQRILLCLAGSYFFYGWWNWYLLSLILISTTIDFLIGRALSKTDSPSRRRLLLYTSIVSNLGILGFFKYFNFFADSLVSLASQFGWTLDWTTLNIVLPVGISFYTFQSLSYTVDIYRKKIPHEPDFIRFATFVSFFPQLVAGPIVRASEFLPQLQADRKYQWSDTVDGFGQVLLGFFKKVVVADSIAIVVDPMYEFPAGYGSLNILIIAFLFSVQVYGDFAGYSDIAIGTARMLGFEFPKNFNFPFFASSLTDFWRRWHITLSTWLRDYVYIPMGGNRGTNFATSRNVFLTMLIGGLWHGAAWTYVIWGALFGLVLVVEREVARKVKRFGYQVTSRIVRMSWRAFSPVLVVTFLSFSLIIFRSDSMSEAVTLLRSVAELDGLSFSALHNRIPLLKAMGVTGLLAFGELVCQFVSVPMILAKAPWIRPLAYAVLLWGIAFFGTFTGNSFVYFQF